MFVCLGNICRSPLAHAVVEHKLSERGLSGSIEVESSGTSGYHIGERSDARMRTVAARYGVNINHRSRQFQTGDFDFYDLVLTMDQSNYADVIRLARSDSDKKKVKVFLQYDPESTPPHEVPDPYYGGSKGFDTVYAMVNRAADALIDSVLEVV